MVQFKQKALTLAVASGIASFSATAQENAEIEEFVLEPIIIKGEKIERSVDDTLSSVSVATDEEMQLHADESLHDVMMRTPGVFTTEGNETFSIRGIPVDGLGAGSSDAVSVYVDEALQSRRAVTLAPTSLWDMEQVEIFRGAQSTTQGRNAMAGAIYLKSKDPTFERGAAVQANIGTYGEQGGSLMVNGGLIDDTLAGRLTFDYQEEDGYIYNEFLRKDANELRNVNTRGKLLLLPTDAVEALLTVQHSKNRQGNQSISKVDGVPQFYEVATNIDAFDKVEQTAITSAIDVRLDENWTLTSITSATQTDYEGLIDFDQSPSPRPDGASLNEEEQVLSQELRAGYDNGEGFRGHFGLYAAKTDRDREDVLGTTVVDFLGEEALLAVYEDGFRFNYNRFGDTELMNTAVFGEINWDFMPRWELIVGLRYDRERNETVDSTSIAPVTTFNGLDPDTDALIDGFMGAADPTVTEATYDAWLPKLGISYELAHNQTLGFVAQRAYRAGGASFNLATQESVEFDPEYTNNYEIAYRGGWMADRLRLTANIFWIDWKDQQVEVLTDPADADSVQVENAGESELKGVETLLAYDFNRLISLYTGIAYNDTEYTDFVTDTQDFTGQDFQGARTWMATAGSTFRFENGLSLNLEAVFHDDATTVYVTESDEASPMYKQVTDELRTDSYLLWNTSATYEVDQFLFTAYVRNIFDEQYMTNNQDESTADAGAPRTAGLAARYNF